MKIAIRQETQEFEGFFAGGELVTMIEKGEY